MSDYIINAMAADSFIRVIAADTTQLVQDAVNAHNTFPVATAALGRTLTAAALMSRQLKNPTDSITIQVKGNGPLGGVVAVATADAAVRGYVNNPQVDIPLTLSGKLDVGKAIGRGIISVIKDMGMKEPYNGCVALVSGEIAEDLAYYFASSEQIPSVIALGVLVNPDGSVAKAGGYMIQLMPGVSEEVILKLEDQVSRISSITTYMSEGNSIEDILENILEGMNLKVLSKEWCGFKCNCSRDRMERNLMSLGISELTEMREEKDDAELICHFCDHRYLFNKDQITSLIELIESSKK